MKRFTLSNGMKCVYLYKEGSISSFCIGLNAGAAIEEEGELGLAHLVEHMVFKGTHKRNENQINREFDRLFGFFNAMTNYPYVIYYGTTLSEDLDAGIELYSDILLNPKFPKLGFEEEVNVILEELNEWKEDANQLCEDELLKNSFNEKRIKERIIGNEDDIRNYNLNHVKDFYSKNYVPENTVLTIVSSLDYDTIYSIMDKHFSKWRNKLDFSVKDVRKEDNKVGIYECLRRGINTSRVLYGFSIDKLTMRQIQCLRIVDNILVQGVSSIIYDKLRTEHGIAYDVSSYIKKEPAIGLYTIGATVSPINIDKCINLIDKCIDEIRRQPYYFNDLRTVIKRIKLKDELKYEKTIELGKEFAINELLFNESNNNYDNNNFLDEITSDEIFETIDLVFSKPSIQILKPEESSSF